MLLLEEIQIIEDKDIAVKLAKWCAPGFTELTAEADADISVAKARPEAWAAWTAVRAARVAVARATTAATTAEDEAAAAEDTYTKIAQELFRLTDSKSTYRLIVGSKDRFEQLDEQIKIGCIIAPRDWWVANYESTGRKYGYSEEQVKEYYGYIKNALQRGNWRQAMGD